LKTLLLVALLAAAPAYAEQSDHEIALQMFDDAYAACVDRLDHEGNPVTERGWYEACKTADVLTTLFIEQGYCWTEANREWKRCG
jgi:hypothetical protein